MINAALFIEGGGIRGIYFAGILDYFLDHDIEFSHVIGVSAGALIGACYVSKQAGYSARINFENVKNKNYYGIYSFIRNRNAFNLEYLFNKLLDEKYPFDAKTYEQSKQKLFIIATDCETGNPICFKKGSYKHLKKALIASSNIPFINRIKEYNNLKLVDGGVASHACNTMFNKIKMEKKVIILSKDISYKAKETSAVLKKLYHQVSKKYPLLAEKIIERPKKYNEFMEEIKELEKEGKVFVIRPQKTIDLFIASKKIKDIMKTYNQGYRDAKRLFPEMMKYLNN